MKIIELNQKEAGRLIAGLTVESFSPEKLAAVRKILEEVRKKGDRALRELTEKLDGVKLRSFRVSSREFTSARKVLTPGLRKIFRRVESNIRGYYSRSTRGSWQEGRGDGMIRGERIIPLARAGLYIPGGRAPLISTVLMTAVPAILAGVGRIVLVSPPRPDGSLNPYILAAADFLGLREIYKVGGAQAIAALAFGTETIPRVDKIAGPGNIYVTLAKKEVFGRVDIDLPAGPSEVVILADGSAPPAWAAADLLAQAEHGPGGKAILISPSRTLLAAVAGELEKLLETAARRDILRETLREGAFLVKVKSQKEGIGLINRIAPEHLELMVIKPEKILPRIRNAGAIFLGKYSPVAAGDYAAGPSHVLPTGGGARFFSPLSVNTFLKTSSIIRYNRPSLKNDLEALTTLAELEGLEAHALSGRLRID